jgi:predicted membrane protein
MAPSTGSGDRRITPRLVLGLGVLTVGLLFTAETLGYGDADIVFDYWPVLLIAIGATSLGGRTRSDRLFSAVWIGLGAWLLAWNLDWIEVSPFSLFWPLVFLTFGLYLLTGGRRRRAVEGGEPRLSIVAVMGGVDRRVSSQAFTGGDVTAFMGGGTLDLRQSRLAEPEIELRIFAMWGGYEVRVPPDWVVSIELLPLLGGVEDKRTHQEHVEGAPTLVLKGVVIMGGVELKN